MQTWFSGVLTAAAESIMTRITMFCVVSTLERAARNVCIAWLLQWRRAAMAPLCHWMRVALGRHQQFCRFARVD